MNRTKHMLKMLVAAAVLACGVVRADVPDTEEDIEVQPNGDIWVYPRNDLAKDYDHIQWAVDNVAQYGTVLLKACNKVGQPTPFNMGTPLTFSCITIGRPLTVSGDADWRTVIRGGFAPFLVDTAGSPDAVPTGPVNFEHLDSYHARHSFLRYKAVHGASISDVGVFDVIPTGINDIYPGGEGYAIIMTPLVRTLSGNYSPDKINGSIGISECLFDFSSSGDVGYFEGILVLSIDADMSIHRCHFKNIGGRSIDCYHSTGHIHINENRIESVLAGLTLIPGAGYRRYARAFQCGSTVAGRLLNINFSDNNLDFNPKAYDDYDVILDIVHMSDLRCGRISNNDFFMSAENNKGYDVARKKRYGAGMTLLNADKLVVSGNIFSGNSTDGMVLAFAINTASPPGVHNCTVTGNDLSGLLASRCQVFIDAESYDNYFGPLAYDGALEFVIDGQPYYGLINDPRYEIDFGDAPRSNQQLFNPAHPPNPDPNNPGIPGNRFGPLVKSPVGIDAVRIYIEGHGNAFESNEYHGEVYPWEYGHGIWLMGLDSYGNSVNCPNVIPPLKPSKTLYDYFKDQSKANSFDDDCM